MVERLWHLKNCDLFSNLSDSSIQRLEQQSRTRNFKAGELIGLPNESSDYVFLVTKGTVKLSNLTSDGKESTLGFIAAGEVFGELAVFDASPIEEFVQAVEATTLVMIPTSAVQVLISENAELAIRLTKLVGLRRHRIERRLKNLLFVSHRERLIHLLIDLAEQFGIQDQEGLRINIKLSHQDLANLIGSTRESVTILLGQMRDEGMVAIGRQKVVLTRPMSMARTVHRRLAIRTSVPCYSTPVHAIA